MTLRPIQIATVEQVETLRLIRNATAAGFAHFNGQIAPGRQQQWWHANRASLRGWLYADESGVTVGFGILTRHPDGRSFTTVGVDPDHQGHDYGRQITAHLIGEAPGRVYGCARRDNPAACKLHVEDDWIEIPGPDPRLVYFQTLKADPWPPDAAIEQWSEAGWVLA
jgi:GNAT superfamily N-acetyltransferase